MSNDKELAFEAGKDCALNGANTRNCSFKWFATPELRDSWEEGKATIPAKQIEVENGN